MFAFLCFAQGCGFIINDKNEQNSSDGEQLEEPMAYDPFKPIWEGDIVYNETVVLMEDAEGNYTGNLVFAPTEIISIKNYTLEKEFDTKRFAMDGNKIICTDIIGDESDRFDDIPFMTEAMARGDEGHDEFGLDKMGNVCFTEGIGVVLHQIAVTYRHVEKWDIVPTYAGDKLTNFKELVESGTDVEMFLFGDSITSGCNSSAFLNTEPYLPKWGDAVAGLIGKKYSINVTTINGSEIGGTSADGLGNINIQLQKHYLRVDKAPDIAFIGYGMNDGSGHVSAAKYKANVQGIIDAIRTEFPACDIVLMSTMLANPIAPQYTEETPTYLAKLKELCEENERTVVVDMTSFSAELYKTKKGLDVLANNVNHPSDFMVRAYVYNVMATLFK